MKCARDTSTATCYCEQCAMHLCRACDGIQHAHPSRKSHRRSRLSVSDTVVQPLSRAVDPMDMLKAVVCDIPDHDLRDLLDQCGGDPQQVMDFLGISAASVRPSRDQVPIPRRRAPTQAARRAPLGPINQRSLSTAPSIQALVSMFPNLAVSVIQNIWDLAGGDHQRAAELLLDVQQEQQLMIASESEDVVDMAAAVPVPVHEAISGTAKLLILEKMEECRGMHRRGFSVENLDPTGEDVAVWLVHLFDFDIETQLGRDLQIYSTKYGHAEVTLELMFSANFPNVPPTLRVIRPRFIPLSGPVLLGGTVTFELLSVSQWQPDYSIAWIISGVRMLLEADGGRLNLISGAPYPRHNPSAVVHSTAPVALTLQLKCHAPDFVHRSDLEDSNAILLPLSVICKLRSNLPSRMFWRLQSEKGSTHCGVREFLAPDGVVIVPMWIMQNLGVDEGCNMTVSLVDLPAIQCMKLRPHSVEFLEIENPRVALEVAFRSLVCVSVGDVIRFKHNSVTFYADVVECQPESAHLIDVDVKVDFLPPLDYNETTYRPPERPSAPQRKSLPSRVSGEQLAGHVQCSNCLAVVPAERLTMHELQCRRNIQLCPKCSFPCKIADLQQHMDDMHSVEMCNCGAEVERCFMIEHAESLCPLRPKYCPYCNVVSGAEEVDTHAEYCGTQTTTCSECDLRLLRKELGKHMEAIHGVTLQDHIDTRRARDLYTAMPTAQAVRSEQVEITCPYCPDVSFESFEDVRVHVFASCPNNPDLRGGPVVPDTLTRPVFSSTIRTPRREQRPQSALARQLHQGAAAPASPAAPITFVVESLEQVTAVLNAHRIRHTVVQPSLIEARTVTDLGPVQFSLRLHGNTVEAVKQLGDIGAFESLIQMLQRDFVH